MSDQFILSVDQGTTSSRALAFDKAGQVRAVAQREFRQIFPDDGWVEHDALEIWDTTLACCKDVLAELGAENFAAIAITNQRETAVIWERATGKPIANAIVWQDRRTAEICNGLKEAGHEATITAKPACCSTLIFRPVKSAGCSTMSRAHAPKRKPESWLSARLTVGWSGN